MIKHNQDGAVSGLAISLVFCIFILLGAIVFGAWAFTSRQDYKDNSDQKSAAAAEVARKDESIIKDKQFAEDAKQPLKTYNGPDAYGSIHIEYPKTWSGFVDDVGKSSTNSVIDGYFNPGVVPSIADVTSVFALRAQVVPTPYSEVLNNFSSQQKLGKLSVSAYALPKLPKVVGVKVAGEITDGKTVTMVVLPLRSQSIKVWTEGTQYVNDFNNNILPNLSFAP